MNRWKEFGHVRTHCEILSIVGVWRYTGSSEGSVLCYAEDVYHSATFCVVGKNTKPNKIFSGTEKIIILATLFLSRDKSPGSGLGQQTHKTIQMSQNCVFKT